MANPERPTTLFLDVGGVLLTNGWGGDSRKLAAQQFQLDYKEMDLRHRLTFDTYEIGHITLEEYLHRVVFYQPRSFSMQDFIAFVYQQSQKLPDMIELVCALKSKYKLKVALLSNEGKEITDYRVRTFQLHSFADFFVFSYFTGLRKPDTQIYELALDIAIARPDECVFIDDRPMFAEVATSLGMHGIIHSSVDNTKQQLAVLGLT